MKIAFIGLGIMGSRMAANLLKNGVDLTVYNRSKAPRKALAEQGATTTDSPAEGVKDADIVFSMLADPEVVESVFMEKGGALAAMKKGSIWADCSTVNPSFSRKAGKAAAAVGVNFLDTPVAGTLPHAQNAELVFFCGGEKSEVEKVEPYIKFMGQKSMHLGKVGQGSSFKMLVNSLLAQQMIIFSETVLLGEKMGLDRDFLLSVLPGLKVSAPVTKFKAEMVRSGDYTANFPLELMHKDLHLVTTTAYELNQPLYLANVAKEIFAEANKKGMGRMDFGAVHKYLEEK